MRNKKIIIPIALIVLMAISCVSIVNNAVTTKKEYDSYIQLAQEAEKRQISVDVDAAFASALDVKSNPDVYVQWGSYYSNIGDYNSAITIGEEGLEDFPKNPDLYAFLMENYLKFRDYEAFFETYNKSVSLGATNKKIISLFEENKYSYTLEFESYDEAYPFCGGVARVCSIGFVKENVPCYGYISATGEIAPQFLSAGDFNGDEINVAPVVDLSGQAYYINNEGFKKYVVAPKGITVKKLGMYVSGVVPVFDGTNYYMCNINSDIIAGPFEFVSTINMDIGAVKQDGQWKLVNQQGKQIINETFTDIKLDSKNVAYRDGFFAQVDGVYYLFNKKGEKVSNTSFEDAELFSDGLAAVKNNDKWGFIDHKGNLVIDYKYQDAHSFSNGFAAVMNNGRWGYIRFDDNSEELVIDYQFDDAVGFSLTSNISLVKIGGKWKVLKLYI